MITQYFCIGKIDKKENKNMKLEKARTIIVWHLVKSVIRQHAGDESDVSPVSKKVEGKCTGSSLKKNVGRSKHTVVGRFTDPSVENLVRSVLKLSVKETGKKKS